MSGPESLGDKLIQEPLFRSQFNIASDLREAVKIASHYGVSLSIDDLKAYRKELRSTLKPQSFHLGLIRTVAPSLSYWGDHDAAGWGGSDAGAAGSGSDGCSHFGGGCDGV